MKKSDLKTGMTVELRNGSLCKVLGDVKTDHYGIQEFILVWEKSYIISEKYNKKLKQDTYSEFDIMKIYSKISDVWEGYDIGDICVWTGLNPAIFIIEEFKGDYCKASNNFSTGTIRYTSMHRTKVRKATDFEKILLDNNDIYIK